MSRWAAVGALVLVGVAFGSPAAAGESDNGQVAQDHEHADMAQRLFEKGYRAYSEKEYAKALSLWRKAYEYVPEATFLYNAASAASKLGNLDQALGLAKRAAKQKERPLAPQLEEKNKKLIKSLNERIERRKRQRELEKARGLDWRGWSGAGGVAAGGTLVGLALGLFGNKASQLNAGLQEASTRSVYDERRARMERKQATGQVLLYTGAGLAVAGAGLLAWDVLDMPQDRELSFRFGTRGRLGATVQFQF